MPIKPPSHRRADQRALISLTLGALMISFSGVWVKISHVTPTVSAFYRVFIGGLFLLLVSLWRKEMHLFNRIQMGFILLCGAFFTLDLVFYHYSVHYVGPGLGTILPNFQVFIMAAVGVAFFKEKLRWAYLVSVPLASLGLILIVGMQWHSLGEQYKLGVYLGLAASICYAGYMLSLRRLHADDKQISSFTALMLVSLVTAGFIAVEVVRTNDSFAIPDLQSLLSLTGLGICSQGVGWILIAYALPRVRMSLAGLILLLQPALAFVWDVFFFDRPTDLANWMGVICILAAIYMGTTGGKRNDQPRHRSDA